MLRRIRPAPARRRRVVLAAVAALVAGFVLLSLRLFAWPATGDPDGADAVVLFAGGRGERLEVALRVRDEIGAPNLVISNGTTPEWPDANDLCTTPQPFRVWCPTPDPDTTRGEARTMARLAAEHGWRKVAMVTSTYHVTRAHLLLDRCYDGRVAAVRADPHLGWVGYTGRIVEEWLSTAWSLAVARSC